MPAATRSITRLQDADDLTFTGGAGEDGYRIVWDNGTSKFIMEAVSSDHSALSNLDYASAGHTGFARTGGTNTFTGVQTFNNAIVVNEGGNNADTRIESVNYANMFYVDANTDRIGIGTDSPVRQMHFYVSGSGDQYIRLQNDVNTWDIGFDSGEDFIVRDVTDSNAAVIEIQNGAGAGAFFIKSTGVIGFQENDPSGQLHVTSVASTIVALQLQGAASQSAPVMRVYTSTDTEKYSLSIEGIADYRGTMGNSSLDPTTDAPADWVEIAIGGTTYYLPAYAAS